MGQNMVFWWFGVVFDDPSVDADGFWGGLGFGAPGRCRCRCGGAPVLRMAPCRCFPVYLGKSNEPNANDAAHHLQG